MSRPRLLFVVGARPNFVKAAPVVSAARADGGFRVRLVHTGQHYDAALSSEIFRDLELPEPDLHLGVGSGSHAAQTAEVMVRLEPVLQEEAPDGLVVFGDVNSTLAAAITAAKLEIPIAHVEAGLRSFDDTMPEEINRRLTDVISRWLFATEESAVANLRREGHAGERVFLVGNTMIDSLERHRRRAREKLPELRRRLRLGESAYAVLTLHRPSNVDDAVALDGLLAAFERIGSRLPVLFPVHPRTRARLEGRPAGGGPGLRLLEPLSYLDFLALMDGARLVLTDSGGIQEETTALGVPCLTLRDNTERPATVELGTNRLVGNDPARILSAVDEELAKPFPRPSSPPPLWDGRAAGRILDVLRRDLGPPPATDR
ncbi:MAG: UDP-N-acetylglucosamine 2-epimerase (non-hydrolyzing) [Thermoanaerobaculia bacterium]|nr:UDP-N-acetylglucosamine 2-epimerase (non-hydrolyzing) [Thermoanaerobaculia bacterium]